MSRVWMAIAVFGISMVLDRFGIHTTVDWAGGICAGLFLTWIAGYERTDK